MDRIMNSINSSEFPSLEDVNSAVYSRNVKGKTLKSTNSFKTSKNFPSPVSYSDKLKGSERDINVFQQKNYCFSKTKAAEVNGDNFYSRRESKETKHSEYRFRESYGKSCTEGFHGIKKQEKNFSNSKFSHNFVKREHDVALQNSNFAQESVSHQVNSPDENSWSLVVNKNHRFTPKKQPSMHQVVIDKNQNLKCEKNTKVNKVQFTKSVNHSARGHSQNILSRSDEVNTKGKTIVPNSPKPSTSNYLNTVNSTQMNYLCTINLQSIGTTTKTLKQKSGSHQDTVNTFNKNQENLQEKLTKKRRPRLNKVKRQTAFQTGKVMLLTPELHSRIASQMSESSIMYSKFSKQESNNIQNIEKSNFPEINDTVQSTNCTTLPTPISQLPNHEKESEIQYGFQLEKQHDIRPNDVIKKYEQEEEVVEKIVNPKTKVCPREPITLLDLLNCPKPHTKPKCNYEESTTNVFSPRKSKSIHAFPTANVLDATAPMKRGKEREKPKLKKPTSLKKIILQEREERKKKKVIENSPSDTNVGGDDQPENNTNTTFDFTVPYVTRNAVSDPIQPFVKNSCHSDYNVPLENFEMPDASPARTGDVLGDDYFYSADGSGFSTDNSPHNEQVNNNIELSTNAKKQSFLECALVIADIYAEQCIRDALDDVKNILLLKKFRTCDLSKRNLDDLVGSEAWIAISNETKLTQQPVLNENTAKPISRHEITVDLESDMKDSIVNQSEICKQVFQEMPLVAENPNTALEDNYLVVDSKSVESFSFKLSDEQTLDRIGTAIKIALHTKSFRPYCNHFLRKDLDECVLALVADLVRFQDRLHQKDPVKAHIKRRLIYGIKEVTKHVKLKKLKCIIIAPNLEDIKTTGGLNDALTSLIRLCYEYHTQCVFSVDRKQLGQICHKPVPVSCVGVFNYEGSEANFKKIINLVDDSTKEYKAVSKMLRETFSTSDVEDLIHSSEEAPETLLLIRRRILQSAFDNAAAEITIKSLQELCSKYIVKL